MSGELREYADVYQGTPIQTQADYQERGTLTFFLGNDERTLDVATVRQLVADLNQFIEGAAQVDGSWESLGDDEEHEDGDDYWEDDGDDEYDFYEHPANDCFNSDGMEAQ